MERHAEPAPSVPVSTPRTLPLDHEGVHHELVARIGVGRQPKQVAFLPDSSAMIVSLLDDTGVDIIDPVPATPAMERRVRRVVPADYGNARGFVEVVIDRDRVLVSQMTTGLVHVFDFAGRYLTSVSTHGTWSKCVAVDAKHRYLVISNWLSDTVTVLDPADGALLRQIRIDAARTPRGVAFTPDGALLLIAWYGTGELTAIRTEDWSAVARIGSGGAYRHVVVHPVRAEAYVSDMARRRVHVVDLIRMTETAEIRVGSNPNTIALSSDGSLLYVSCRGPNNPDGYERRSPQNGEIYVIDTATRTIVDTLPGGNQPTGLAISPDGNWLASTSFQDDEVVLYAIHGAPWQ